MGIENGFDRGDVSRRFRDISVLRTPKTTATLRRPGTWTCRRSLSASGFFSDFDGDVGIRFHAYLFIGGGGG